VDISRSEKMAKSKVKYDPPNRPPMMKPGNDDYRKNYDKIFNKKNSIKVVVKTFGRIK